MASKKDVVAFVEKFKNEVVLPCAVEGILDADILSESIDIFLEELLQQEAASRIVSVTKDGTWRALHPLTPAIFEVDGKIFASITHYKFAVRYFGADDECAEYIMEARTPEIAHRRGEEMMGLNRVKREDWEYSEEEHIKKAYKVLLSNNQELLTVFLATSSSIEFTNTSDAVLGSGTDGKGKNILPKILRELRKEMKRN
jgi:predicted NAD-dependent protein-ADP-ribosyltransferase YbiA (DUF1768 family)